MNVTSTVSPGATDADLVHAARAGDKAAFAVLLERHRPMVLALVVRLLGGSDGAPDCVQEAAVTALVGLTRLRTPERFGSWFAGIALNVARRWLRDARLAASSGERAVADGSGHGADPLDAAIASDLAQHVQRAVAELPPGQRSAVLAFYWQGLSHAEAAAELGISPGAVKARLHQARAALAPELARQLTDVPSGGRSCEESFARTHEREEAPVMPTRTDHRAPSEERWEDVAVVEVRRSGSASPDLRFYAVVLEEKATGRRAPIYVGASEAVALACSLESLETPRPMTYAMAAQLVTASGARVLDVRVTNLVDGVVYAVVRVDGPTGPEEIDARPSDALNLALVCEAPVLVDKAAFDELARSGWREWQEFPTGTHELVAERVESQAALMALADSIRNEAEGGS